MELLFICTGNTCRSPMAKALMEKAICDNDIKNVSVKSAGTFAVDGESATRSGVVAMKKKGIDNSGHRARRVSELDLKSADYIFVMDGHNYEYIEVKYPQYLGKTHMLSQFTGLGVEILDPYHLGQDVYENAADLLEKCTNVIVKKIKENNM